MEHTDLRPLFLASGPTVPWPRTTNGTEIVKPERDRARVWLRNAGMAVAALAVAAAVVSFQAQYALIFTYKHVGPIAYIQAGIPDIGSLVFASLGIALALHGKRAVRARTLNVVCVGISIAMNVLAATSGWPALAVWVMAPVVYALASDTLIGVIRAYTVARQRALDETLADEGVTPLQVVGAVLLWALRLALAPASTLRGFRRWVLTTPVSPRPRVVAAAEPRARPGPKRPGSSRQRTGGKGSAVIRLAGERHDLTTLPIKQVSSIATGLAAEADIHPATARRVLLGHVRSLQNGRAVS